MRNSISFNSGMIRAVRENRKTMTRRPIKPQPEAKFNNGDWYPDRYNHTEEWCFWGKKGTDVQNKCGLPMFKSPYQIGQILHVTPRSANCPDVIVTNIKVERVQDISNEDIRKEGAACFGCVTHRLNFQQLWDSIYLKSYPWLSNPWVYAIEFKVMK